MRREGGRAGFLDSAHTTAEGPTFSPTTSHSAWSQFPRGHIADAVTAAGYQTSLPFHDSGFYRRFLDGARSETLCHGV